MGSWFEDRGFGVAEREGQPVPGMPGFVYNAAGGIEPVDGTPNGPGEVTNENGVTTTTAPVTTNTPAATAATGNRQQDVMAILSRFPHTPAGLQQALPEIQKLYPGVKIMGSKGDKLDFGDGEIVDTILAAGEGGRGWTWQSSKDAGSSSAPDGGGLASLIGNGSDPFGYAGGSLLTPFTEEYKNTYGDAPKFEAYQDLVLPEAEKLAKYEAPAPYVAPTMDEVRNDPGYEFGLKEGRGALENAAAARRFLHTGSTLKDIIKYGTDYATTKYNDAVSRGMSIYDLNTSKGLQANQANNAAIQTNNVNAAERVLKPYEFGYNQNLAKNTFNKGSYDTDVANSFASFLQRYNQFNSNKKMQYDMLTGLAGLGA